MKRLAALLSAVALAADAQYVHRSAPPQPADTPPTITTAGSGNCTGTGCVVVSAGGTGTALVKITGTWVATLNFVGSNDGWVSNAALPAYPYSTSTGALSAAVNTTTANGTWLVVSGPFREVGVYASAFTSGTASVRADADPASGLLLSYLASLLGGGGTTTVNQGTPAAAANAWPVTENSTLTTLCNAQTTPGSFPFTCATILTNTAGYPSHTVRWTTTGTPGSLTFNFLGCSEATCATSPVTLATGTGTSGVTYWGGAFPYFGVSITAMAGGSSPTVTITDDSAYGGGVCSPAGGSFAVSQLNPTTAPWKVAQVSTYFDPQIPTVLTLVANTSSTTGALYSGGSPIRVTCSGNAATNPPSFRTGTAPVTAVSTDSEMTATSGSQWAENFVLGANENAVAVIAADVKTCKFSLRNTQ